MPGRSGVSVIGTAIWEGSNDDPRSLEELQHDLARAALSDAGIGFEDIDGIIVAGNDQIDGRAITVMAASGSVGGVDRDILSTPSASEHAFVMGAMRVQSGLFRTQLVMGWSPLETEDLHEVQRLASDPYFHRALPLDEMSAHGLQAAVLENEVDGVRATALAIAAKNRKQGGQAAGNSDRLLRWPLTEAMVAPVARSLVALVLASDSFIEDVKSAKPVRVDGMGWATEAAFLGDRELGQAGALVAAKQRAYEQAGITKPIDEFDFAELADTTPYQELLAYEALDLCGRSDWAARVADGTFASGGTLPVNLSGGAQSVNALFASGLRSIAKAAARLRDDGNARRALVQAASGPAMQYQTVIALGTAAQGAQA